MPRQTLIQAIKNYPVYFENQSAATRWFLGNAIASDYTVFEQVDFNDETNVYLLYDKTDGKFYITNVFVNRLNIPNWPFVFRLTFTMVETDLTSL